jgi:hypothetical protein
MPGLRRRPAAALSISPFEWSCWRLRRAREAMREAAGFHLLFGRKFDDFELLE